MIKPPSKTNNKGKCQLPKISFAKDVEKYTVNELKCSNEMAYFVSACKMNLIALRTIRSVHIFAKEKQIRSCEIVW